MAKRWVTGWKLAERDRERLLARIPPTFTDVIADHVTLRTGTDQDTPLPTATEGAIVGEIDDGAGLQALVLRIGGTTRREDGGTYHITWSLDAASGRRAIESNEVIAARGWRPLAAPIPIELRPAWFRSVPPYRQARGRNFVRGAALNGRRSGPAMKRHARTTVVATLAAGLAAGMIAGRYGRSGRLCRVAEPTYPPLDMLKPLAEALWIVDSGPISAAGLHLPVRMTVARLASGDLLLHSPTRFTPKLARELDALGPVRHLIAPTTAHWSFLGDWQEAYPGAVTWAVPGLRDRAQVRSSGIRIDRDLAPDAPQEWAPDFSQGLVTGGAGFHEAYFFHKDTRTLLLADLIENLEPAKLHPAARLAMWAAGATRATTAHHVRAILRLGGEEAARSIRAMLALSPARVVFAHGRWFEDDGAKRLAAAFGWLRR